MISIREAKIEDLEVIQNFNNKLCAKENREFDPTINPEVATTESGKEYFKESIESDTKITLVAEDNDEIIGYIVGGIEEVSDYRNITNICEAENMWVDEKYRSQGIGKQFMNKLELWAREKGINRMRAIASYKNEKAIKFYKREGYSEYDLILEKDL